jgi:light-regulated signal transduction histidine kinase (bacteriophytochrome)
VIPINTRLEEYILLFRPEVVKITNWGGDPSTRIQLESDMKTYHPRFSFSLWREQITGIALPWSAGELELAEQLRNFIIEHLVPDTDRK